MRNSENVKQSITAKITILILAVLVCLFIYFKLDYEFSNLIINSVILYSVSLVFRFVFTLNSLDIHFNTGSKDFEPDIEEFKAREMELRFKHPKLYAYNQFVLYISITIKVIAILMFIYGGSQLMIVNN